MIHNVDSALATLLKPALESGSATSVEVTFTPPGRMEENTDAGTYLHLYLYDVRECLERRDMSLRPVTREVEQKLKSGRKRPPVYFDLSYLLTVRSDAPAQEHEVFSHALMVLLQTSQLSWGSTEEPVTAPLAISRPDETSATPLEMVWQSLQCCIRPAMRIVVTVPFDPYEPILSPLVREVKVNMEPDAERDAIGAVGFVYDGPQPSGAPLSQAVVSLAGGALKTQTDARGFFYLRNLPRGRHRLTFEKAGYYRRDVAVTVPEAGSAADLEDIYTFLLPLSEGRPEAYRIVETPGCCPDATRSGLLLLNGLPASHVEVRAGSYSTLTDAEGRYAFFDTPAPADTLEVFLPGLGEWKSPISA